MMNKGDIVINLNAGENNPYRQLMYISKYGNEYRTLAFDGLICKIGCKNMNGEDPLVCVGHMQEYDDFIKALRKLNGGEQDAEAHV